MPERAYWSRFLTRLYEVMIDADLFGRAAQSAFYLSFAIFPLLIFLISIFGMIVGSTESLKAQTYTYLVQIMPGAASQLVRNTVDEVITNSSAGKLTLGLIAALWAASAGVDGIRSALNAVYGLRDRRSWWRNKLQSLVLTLAVTMLAGIVLTIVFSGWEAIEFLASKLGIPIFSPLILVAIQWFSILLLMLAACELIYNLMPDFRRFRWKWITPGSIVAIVLWLILTSGFRLYITYLNNYDKAYGSLAAVIVLMLWLYLTALVVMVGGAINRAADDLDKIELDEKS